MEHNPYPLSVYEELEPLCSRGHVVLVRNREDGQLYVKKRLNGCAPELYRQLRDHPVPGTPAICGIYPQEEPGLVIVEEYIPGRTLAEYLQEEGPFSESDTIAIGMALCGILRELHRRRPAIIHRDIKPSNIMRLPDGGIVLLDFSAAKPETPWQRRDTVLMGTAGFAAPEQYGFSPSSAQTDIYSLGVLLNTLLTGTLPWERRAGGKLRRIIARCMELVPKKRYTDARDLHSALKRAGRMRVEWLPPGFRSLKWYWMLPAACFYGIFLLLLTKLLLEAALGRPMGGPILMYLLMTLCPVLFYGNYLDVQRFFPFLRSHRRWLRLLGLLLYPLWCFLFLLVVALLDMYVLPVI